ncbi:MAG: hypothetical protein LAP38_27950, partial [Acidobacteriia bacterium]|nr:hypothetical protein [Terriglobia bacterium]
MVESSGLPGRLPGVLALRGRSRGNGRQRRLPSPPLVLRNPLRRRLNRCGRDAMILKAGEVAEWLKAAVCQDA